MPNRFLIGALFSLLIVTAALYVYLLLPSVVEERKHSVAVLTSVRAVIEKIDKRENALAKGIDERLARKRDQLSQHGITGSQSKTAITHEAGLCVNEMKRVRDSGYQVSFDTTPSPLR